MTAILLTFILVLAQLTADHVEVNGLLGDLWVETDAIWRAHLGQEPNRDFITPLGPFFYGVYRFLSLFEPPSLAIMIHGNLLVGLLAALLAYGIARRSARPEAVLLLMVLAFFTAASGRAIGTPLAAQSVPYIVPYNRWSWAIALPCAFGLLIPHARGARTPFVLIAAGLTALFFTKLTYFLGVAGLAAAAFLIDAYRAEDRREAVARALTLLVSTMVFVGIGALLSSPARYLVDVQSIAAANYVIFRLIKLALQSVEAGLMLGLALVILFLASGLRRIRWTDATRLFLVTACGAAIMSQNHENNESPLYFGALLVAYSLGRIRMDEAADAPGEERMATAAFYLTFLLLLTPLTADAGTAAIVRLRAAAKPQPPIEAFAGTPLADLRSNDAGEIEKVTDGLALLGRVGQAGRTVLPFIMGNPFSALTGTRSPCGAMAIWYYGRTFSEDHLPPPERALGDAEFLLIAKGDATSDWLWRLYEPAIRTHYARAGESRYWIAWRRTAATAPTGTTDTRCDRLPSSSFLRSSASRTVGPRSQLL